MVRCWVKFLLILWLAVLLPNLSCLWQGRVAYHVSSSCLAYDKVYDVLSRISKCSTCITIHTILYGTTGNESSQTLCHYDRWFWGNCLVVFLKYPYVLGDILDSFQKSCVSWMNSWMPITVHINFSDNTIRCLHINVSDNTVCCLHKPRVS